MGEASGWERPNWYAIGDQKAEYEYSYKRQNWFENSAAEHIGCREHVALFDQTSFSKYLVQGRDAASVLNRICANDIDVEPGTSVYGAWLNDKGGIEADLTVNRIDENEFMVITAVATQIRDMDWLKKNTPADANVSSTDITSGLSCLAIQGPNSRALSQGLTDADLSNDAFPFGAARDIDIGYAKVTALRMTYVGELGWELYIPTEFTTHVYDLIVNAGVDHGLVHAGYHATNSLRLEKAFRHWGHDITDEDTPLEAGLSFACAFDKPGGFIGRDALLAQKAAGFGKRLVQFMLDDPEPMLYHDHPIYRDAEMVGHTTSGMYGHTVGSALAMGYVNTPSEMPRANVIDAPFELQVNGMRYSQASFRPFYDPTSARTKM